MLTISRPQENDESVYKLLPKPAPTPCKPKRYTSKYPHQVREETERNKIGDHKTFGFVTVPLKPPPLYLRKHTKSAVSYHPRLVSRQPHYSVGSQTAREQDTKLRDETSKSPESLEKPERKEAPPPRDWLRSAPHRSRHCMHEAKPRVPATCCCRFVRLERGQKDFILDNTVSAVRQPAKIPVPRYVDDPKGNSRDWCKSGLARKYVMRLDFGAVPEYLIVRKAELKAKEEQEKQIEEGARQRAQEKCRHLTEAERHELISGLEKHWNDVYNEFQSFPLVVDRPLAVKQKAGMEQKLKEIEKDIDFVEKHNHIFVSDAPKTFYLH